jgi:hypothetical protein
MAGYGITAVAVVTAVVSFCLGSSLFVYTAGFYSRGSRMGPFIECLKIYAPYLYILGGTLIIKNLLRPMGIMRLDALFLGLRIILILLLSLPLILRLNNRIHFIDGLFTAFREKVGGLISTHCPAEDL